MGIPQRLLAAAMLLATSGCVLPGNFLHKLEPSGPGVCEIAMTWNNKVLYVPDPARGGTPCPGISGRLYLFGPAVGFPLVGDGALVIDLFDDAPGGPQGGKHLEQWTFDPVTLRRLLKKDIIGEGYTIFLPWGTFSHDVKAVHLTARYEPAHGTPLYSPSGPVTLAHENSPVAAPAKRRARADSAHARPAGPRPGDFNAVASHDDGELPR